MFDFDHSFEYRGRCYSFRITLFKLRGHIRRVINDNFRVVNVSMRSVSIKVGEINLHSGKILLPKLMPWENINNFVGTNNPIRLMHDVSPLEGLMGTLLMLITKF